MNDRSVRDTKQGLILTKNRFIDQKKKGIRGQRERERKREWDVESQQTLHILYMCVESHVCVAMRLPSVSHTGPVADLNSEPICHHGNSQIVI